MTRRAGVGQPDHSFATWFWDYDNDGRLDLLVTGYYTERNADIGAFFLGMPHKAEVPRLYHNRGDGRFDEVAHKLGLDRVILPMGANFGDLDNDGWLDCYFRTGIPDYQGLLPNRMFRSDAGRRFQDVTTAGGFGHLQKGHGVAFADLDGDGDHQPADTLNLDLNLEFLALFVSARDLTALASGVLDANLPPGFVPIPETLSIQQMSEPVIGKDGLAH